VSESERINGRQRKAIRALLSAPSIVAAAEASGIGESTIRRWISEDSTFRNALREAERELWDDARRALSARAAATVEALAAVAEDDGQPGSTRVQACKVILDQLSKLHADDLTERVEVLEVILRAEEANDEQ
jgi:uncharacterized protein (UPF0147 family)